MLRKSSMLPANSWISQQVKVRQLTEIECSEIDFTYLRCTQQMSNYVPQCLGDVRGVINTSLGGCNETNDAGPSTGGSCKDQFSAQVHFTLRSIWQHCFAPPLVELTARAWPKLERAHNKSLLNGHEGANYWTAARHLQSIYEYQTTRQSEFHWISIVTDMLVNVSPAQLFHVAHRLVSFDRHVVASCDIMASESNRCKMSQIVAWVVLDFLSRETYSFEFCSPLSACAGLQRINKTECVLIKARQEWAIRNVEFHFSTNLSWCQTCFFDYAQLHKAIPWLVLFNNSSNSCRVSGESQEPHPASSW